MKSSDIRKALNRTKRAYNDLREVDKLIAHDNGDESMQRAGKASLHDVVWLGQRLANCTPNGELLNPEFFGRDNIASTAPMNQPRSFAQYQTVDPAFPNPPHTLPSWCEHCDNPKSACTCPSNFKR